MKQSGMKLILRSPVFRLAVMEQAQQEIAVVERLVPWMQNNPEVAMALDTIRGLKSTLAKLDFSPDWMVSQEEYDRRKEQSRQAEDMQAQADIARTAAQSYQAYARASSQLNESGGETMGLRNLIERGM